MANARFQRCSRLITKADYGYVFACPEKNADRHFTVLSRVNQSQQQPRLGLAVSKKVSKSAVVRNRIKRAIRESFRHYQCRLSGIDIVVIARPPAARQPHPQLREAMDQHWQTLEQPSCNAC